MSHCPEPPNRVEARSPQRGHADLREWSGEGWTGRRGQKQGTRQRWASLIGTPRFALLLEWLKCCRVCWLVGF